MQDWHEWRNNCESLLKTLSQKVDTADKNIDFRNFTAEYATSEGFELLKWLYKQETKDQIAKLLTGLNSDKKRPREDASEDEQPVKETKTVHDNRICPKHEYGHHISLKC